MPVKDKWEGFVRECVGCSLVTGHMIPVCPMTSTQCGGVWPLFPEDGVFISLWLLVQRREVALEYALRHPGGAGLKGVA